MMVMCIFCQVYIFFRLKWFVYYVFGSPSISVTISNLDTTISDYGPKAVIFVFGDSLKKPEERSRLVVVVSGADEDAGCECVNRD
ncbi:hypothetical protein L6452_14621 [Arctium lappa]|uniref:Uncharacterized protein n=1 Tax=Arctium lappa TaxID=4217 RepID=A0ACB9CLK0_ARCLA|nr:hypothetical protein L6452_14621 [Arctium lappa]